MAVSFEFMKTLHGSPNERFIQLVSNKHKVTSIDQDISWESGKCKDNNQPHVNSTVEESFRPLSIQTGKNQYWALNTAWGIFEFPNMVSDIIEKKFIEKYGKDNISTHKYKFQIY